MMLAAGFGFWRLPEAFTFAAFAVLAFALIAPFSLPLPWSVHLLPWEQLHWAVLSHMNLGSRADGRNDFVRQHKGLNRSITGHIIHLELDMRPDLRQGCPLSPYLLSMVLTHLFHDVETQFTLLYGLLSGVIHTLSLGP